MPKVREGTEEIEVCPECGSHHLVRDYERGELLCEDCGLVLDDQFIDQGPEWRAFDVEQGEKRARTGAPMTYTIHDKGLSTEISWKNKDSYGKSIPTRNRAQLYRLRKWQRRIRVSNATERNLAFALSELDRMASAMGLPRNVRETAAMIYRKAVNKNLIRGRSIEGVVAASLYAACRQCGVPRTLDEVANSSRVGRKEIGRTYRFMTRELKLKLMAPGLRPEVLLRAQAERRGPEQGRRDPQGRLREGTHIRKGAHRCRSRRDLHLLDPVQRAQDPEGGRRCGGSDRGHHQEPLQGTHREARDRDPALRNTFGRREASAFSHHLGHYVPDSHIARHPGVGGRAPWLRTDLAVTTYKI